MENLEIIHHLEHLKNATNDITIRHHINAAILRAKQLEIAAKCEHEILRVENHSPYGLIVEHTCSKCGELISSKLDK